mmetsp:Transcript_46884/g.109528  ORF Transcript_46884/g.109528 Transcript_46884/m.109528 type:complete len:117 (-) Transcript_46884:49-399(-)
MGWGIGGKSSIHRSISDSMCDNPSTSGDALSLLADVMGKPFDASASSVTKDTIRLQSLDLVNKSRSCCEFMHFLGTAFRSGSVVAWARVSAWAATGDSVKAAYALLGTTLGGGISA